MEGEGPPPSPPAAAAAISALLGDDDLLGEILLRVAFPTSLVRASLVCKRWLRHASAPAFLRRFRCLHPPRLLGFYVDTMGTKPPRFVPMPQPHELAAVVRRASFDLETLDSDRLYMDCCWNGLLLITFVVSRQRPTYIRRVRCPLYPARYTAILPPVPDTCIHDGFKYYEGEILPNGGGDGLSYFYFALGSKEQQTVADVYVLQDGLWAIYTSAVSDIPKFELLLPETFIIWPKIYNVALVSNVYKLVLLDLVSSSLSVVNLPEEVNPRGFGLSLADDSGVHLTHVKGFQLRIWLHRMDCNGVGNWFLVDTICLREICANHMIPTCAFEDGHKSVLKVHAVGINSEFVFLEMDGVLYLFDIRRKAVKKVYEVTPEDKQLYDVFPFMMVWPPKFPVMKEGYDQKE